MTAVSKTKDRPAAKVKKKISGRLIAVIVSAAVVCVAGCAYVGKQIYDRNKHNFEVASMLDTNLFYKGIRVQGVNVGGMTMQEAEKAVKAKETSAVEPYNIRITYGSKAWVLTQKDMTFSYNTDDVLKQAYAYGRSGDREARYKQVTALKTTPKDYSVTASLNESAFKTKVEKIASSVNTSASEPAVVSFSTGSRAFAFRDGVNGVVADSAKLWSDVKSVAEGKHTGTVELSVKSVPFHGSLANLQAHMKKLGTFSTVSTNTYNGTYNMQKALLDVNGTKIAAGGTFSFLNTVGPCDRAHGYLPAGALFNGRHTQEYGGGICQASTTVYGAALRSGLKVAERYNHSMPSTYCEIGQDATVSYPDLDLKMKNTTAYPVYIVTETSGKQLRATFYGYQPDNYDRVEITSQIDATYPAPTTAKYTEDSSLAAGQVELEQYARKGYQASAKRIYYKNGSVTATENLSSSSYPAMPAYYSYGKGPDPSKIGGASSASSAAR